MSTYLNTYVNNILVEGIMDLRDREVELNYDRDKDNVERQTNIGTVRLSREALDVVMDCIASGLVIGGLGALEGIPYREEVVRGGVVEVIFNGYIDLTQKHTLNRETFSEVTVTEKESVDWLNDVADGVSYEYLESIGKILPTDYEWMPYILNSIPDYSQAAIATLSIYVMVEQVKTVIDHIAELGAEMGNPFETATAIIRMVLFVAYLIALFIALVKLVNDIVRLLIQPVKYHACMSLRKHLEKGAEALGYTFSATFFTDTRWNNLYLMPEKLYVAPTVTDTRILGLLTPNPIVQKGYFKGTFGDVIRMTKTIFKSKVIVQGGVIKMMRRDESTGTPMYQLDDYYEPRYRLNTDEFISNYVISFDTDSTDKNTIQEYEGTSYQVITQPINVGDQKLVLMKNLSEQRIPLALAKRKTELTTPEKIVLDFLDVFSDLINGLISAVNIVIDVYNSIVDTINSIINALDFIGIDVGWEIPTIPPVDTVDLGNIIENRIGMMKIEYDNFTVPKIFIMQKGSSPKYNKINPSNDTWLSAKTLWDEFHFIDSMMPGRPAYPNGNQCEPLTLENIPFTFTDFQKVKQNDMLYDFDGDEQEIISIKWRPEEQSADIQYRHSEVWTRNLQETYLQPTGS